MIDDFAWFYEIERVRLNDGAERHLTVTGWGGVACGAGGQHMPESRFDRDPDAGVCPDCSAWFPTMDPRLHYHVVHHVYRQGLEHHLVVGRDPSHTATKTVSEQESDAPPDRMYLRAKGLHEYVRTLCGLEGEANYSGRQVRLEGICRKCRGVTAEASSKP
jgi:hypothetical protein